MAEYNPDDFIARTFLLPPNTNESTINDLKQYFDIKKPTTLDDYLSVQVITSNDQKRAWLGQPTIIDALTKKYGKEVDNQ